MNDSQGFILLMKRLSIAKLAIICFELGWQEIKQSFQVLKTG